MSRTLYDPVIYQISDMHLSSISAKVSCTAGVWQHLALLPSALCLHLIGFHFGISYTCHSKEAATILVTLYLSILRVILLRLLGRFLTFRLQGAFLRVCPKIETKQPFDDKINAHLGFKYRQERAMPNTDSLQPSLPAAGLITTTTAAASPGGMAATSGPTMQTPNKSAPSSASGDCTPHDASQACDDVSAATDAIARNMASTIKPERDPAGPFAASSPRSPSFVTPDTILSTGPPAAPVSLPPTLPTPAAASSGPSAALQPHPDVVHKPVPVPRGCGRISKQSRTNAWLKKRVARQQQTIRQQERKVNMQNEATGGCMQLLQQQLAASASGYQQQAEWLADTVEQLADTVSSNQQQAEQLRVTTSCLRGCEAFIEALQQQLADSASSNQRQAEDSHQLTLKKDRWLRASEARVEALEQQLVDGHRQLAASRLTRARRYYQQKLDDCTQQREHARQEVVRLRGQMQSMQLEHDKIHHVYDDVVRKYIQCTFVWCEYCAVCGAATGVAQHVAASVSCLSVLSLHHCCPLDHSSKGGFECDLCCCCTLCRCSCILLLLSLTPGLCLEQHSSPSFTQRILTIQLCCDVTGFAPSSHCCQLAARAFLDLHAPPKLYCQVTLSAAAPAGPTRASLQALFVVGQWHVRARSRVLQPCPGAICGEEAHSSVYSRRHGQGGQESGNVPAPQCCTLPWASPV